MAYTTQDLAAVEQALATGALTIESQGKRVTYRNQRELQQLRAQIAAELGATPGPSIDLTYVQTESDL